MDKYWKLVINLANKAAKKKEVPVGAIVVKNGKVIACGYNEREKTHNIMGHAEIIAIKKASKVLKTWKLNDCDLYVSLKPCSMCENIIKQSRISNVCYLLDKPSSKREFYNTNFQKYQNNTFTEEYQKNLSDFFDNLRK